MNSKPFHFRKDHTIRSFNEDGTFTDQSFFTGDGPFKAPSINAAKRASRAIGLHKVARCTRLPTER